MPRLSADPIGLTTEQKADLDGLIKAHSTPQQLAVRARMIGLAHEGVGVQDTARRLGVWARTVRRWRRRWLTADPMASVVERLSDAPRPGAPVTFTAEQVCAIIALACETPEASGLPLSHWSQSELAREAVRRGLVDTISHGSIGRILKRSRPSAASRPAVAHRQAGS
jgi:putative transposase